MIRVVLLLSLFALLPLPAIAQVFPDGDWGDAPENGVAYPWLGVGGKFPTCFGIGTIDSYIFHAQFPGPNCWFGPAVDIENDGNAGICHSPPYDRDECYGPLDGDAGLVMPTAFSYGPTMQTIVCSGLPPTSLGTTCGTARWGRDIDIRLTNNLAPGEPAYVNVLMDFDRDGQWAPFPVGPFCGAQIPEHVARNVLVPPGFSGLLSQLPNGDFQLAPDSGLVWVRFTITNQPVLFPWDGRGSFEHGESEDYLLRIESAGAREYGDAPYGVLAYPDIGQNGFFPTCVSTPDHVVHDAGASLWLGPGVDYEMNGNHDDCGFLTYDDDECGQGSDAGINVIPYTIVNGLYQGCSPGASTIGAACQPLGWGSALDVSIHNGTGGAAYLNALMDWDHDGQWDANTITCPGGGTSFEQVISNLVVPAGYNGGLGLLGPPATVIGSPGYAWARFTLSDIPAPAGWTGGGSMGHGETEDYLLHFDPPVTGVESGGERHVVFEPWPNPARGQASLEYRLGRDARVALEVYDATGRRVRSLGPRAESRGPHRLTWDGRTATERPASTGTYFLRLTIDGEVHSRRVLLVH